MLDMLHPPITRLNTGTTGVNREIKKGRSVSGRKHNHCVILLANLDTKADGLQKIDKCWFIQTNDASDLTVTIGKHLFHLHKLSMVSRSGYLNRLVFQRRSTAEANSSVSINIDNLPGGYEIFQLIVRFCYGLAVDLTAQNAAPLYCAADFLEMADDFQPENLISKTKAFLSFIIFSSWKDTIQILKSCEDMLLLPENLGISKECSDSIAWKACIDPRTISCYTGDSQAIEDSWWFDDVSTLKIDHFAAVINAAKARGMKPRLVGSSIAYWTSKWLGKSKLRTNCELAVQREIFESLIKLLPDEKNLVCGNYLLHLLKVGLVLEIDSEIMRRLERKVALMLESISAGDLIVENYEHKGTKYDVSLIIRAVEAYVTNFSRDQMSRSDLVGQLVDDYLALVARDNYLSVDSFQLLADALPENARLCTDKLYRATDMYLKAHPTLTEEERRSVCRATEFHKLSQEARNHAVKNDRLPLNIAARLILWEQINIKKSMLSKYANCKRSQGSVSVINGFGKKWYKTNKELQTMKTEVEELKIQLTDLQTCGLKLQNQVNIGRIEVSKLMH